MNSFLRNVGFYLLVIFIAITAYDYFSVKPEPVEETSYSQFLEMVDKGEVTKVTLVKNTIQITKKDGGELTTIAPDEPISQRRGDHCAESERPALVDDAPVVTVADIAFGRRVVLYHHADAGRRLKSHVVRQKSRKTHGRRQSQSDVQRRGRCRRSQRRTSRGRRIPQAAEKIQRSRRTNSQRRVAFRSSRHGQNSACKSRRG